MTATETHRADPRRERAEAALLGAFAADAAALGLHWLYDPARIAALAGPLAFRTPDAADFEGAKGVFVHGGKRAGDLSQYGWQLRTMLRALVGGFDPARAQDRFAASFGPGGDWVGYVDRPTKGTLERLAAGERAPSGVEDDQLPAVSRLPALLARPEGATEAEIDVCVSITNTGIAVRDWARAYAAALSAALAGASLPQALLAGETAAAPEVAAALERARESDADPVDYAGEVGRACHLPQGLPVMVRCLVWAGDDGRAALEANIRAGGDSCGRAVAMGALLGASRGIGGRGVPAGWVARLAEGPALAAEIDAVLGG